MELTVQMVVLRLKMKMEILLHMRVMEGMVEVSILHSADKEDI